ncbi:pentapeptide repeat-containing protein [Baaleninema simplex]|uniref:pentapeptide repeat-containing protein n=1 Tax=Baaleninema simplex TaxID=2862350 RepID=UPI00034AAACE|nr:pentapeptide repeat-containing protein [Baaleninema simplex]
MANAEHLWTLKRGVEVWNRWREENDRIVPNLHDADLRGLKLAGANLRRACLSETSLSLADLREADLREADLYEADLFEANLDGAKLDRAYLFRANFYRASLYGVSLYRAMLGRADLTKASVRDADLTEASLSEANLTQTNFTGSNLSKTFLKSVRAIATVFDEAILTGACLQDWQTDGDTRLERAVCEFVFFEYDVNQHLFRRRYPRNPGQMLEPGALAALFAPKPQVFGLSVSASMSWTALRETLETLQTTRPEDELQLSAIEQTEAGKLVLRLSVSAKSDVLEVERLFRQEYERVCQLEGSVLGSATNGKRAALFDIVRVLSDCEGMGGSRT